MLRSGSAQQSSSACLSIVRDGYEDIPCQVQAEVSANPLYPSWGCGWYNLPSSSSHWVRH
jgi:hypothetical protein